jgi:hypothetical protein
VEGGRGEGLYRHAWMISLASRGCAGAFSFDILWIETCKCETKDDMYLHLTTSIVTKLLEEDAANSIQYNVEGDTQWPPKQISLVNRDVRCDILSLSSSRFQRLTMTYHKPNHDSRY